MQKDDVQPAPLDEVALAISQHPRFTRGVLVYIDEILAWRRSLGRFAWAATSYVGTHVIGFVLLLHYANTTGRSEGGATFGRLLEQCQRRNLCGPRALRTVLNLASVAGYLQTQKGGDKRVQVFVPADKLIAMTRALYRCPMACLDQLIDQPVYAEMARSDPAFISRLMTTAGRQYAEDGILIADYFPQLLELMNLSGGCPVVLALVESHLRDAPCVSTRTLGQQAGVSASQARQILRRASTHGLITLSADGQVIEVDALAGLYQQFVARELALYVKYTLGLEGRFTAARTPLNSSA